MKVFIARVDSATETVEWTCACAYDGDKNCLYTYMPGSKAVVTYAEGGVTYLRCHPVRREGPVRYDCQQRSVLR